MSVKRNVNCAINFDFVIIIFTAFGQFAFKFRDAQGCGTRGRVNCWVREKSSGIGLMYGPLQWLNARSVIDSD